MHVLSSYHKTHRPAVTAGFNNSCHLHLYCILASTEVHHSVSVNLSFRNIMIRSAIREQSWAVLPSFNSVCIYLISMSLAVVWAFTTEHD